MGMSHMLGSGEFPDGRCSQCIEDANNFQDLENIHAAWKQVNENNPEVGDDVLEGVLDENATLDTYFVCKTLMEEIVNQVLWAMGDPQAVDPAHVAFAGIHNVNTTDWGASQGSIEMVNPDKRDRSDSSDSDSRYKKVQVLGNNELVEPDADSITQRVTLPGDSVIVETGAHISGIDGGNSPDYSDSIASTSTMREIFGDTDIDETPHNGDSTDGECSSADPEVCNDNSSDNTFEF